MPDLTPDPLFRAAVRSAMDTMSAGRGGLNLDLLADLLAVDLRPAIYREAAERLHEACAAAGHGGDCPLVCERGSVVLDLETRAGDMERETGEWRNTRGDNHSG